MPEKLGLEPSLYNPPDGKATVDIVFVHGLGGDRIGTWTFHPDSKYPVTTLWPKDFLPKACPTARILSFGYNSQFVKFFPFFGNKAAVSTETSITDYSTALFHDLAGIRTSTKTPADRPIIFVAHSLGGLVVAHALSRPHSSDEAATNLSANTKGIIFMGTPFAGSDKATWGAIGLNIVKALKMQTKDTDVTDLNERSAALVTINREFDEFIKARDRDRKAGPVEIVCYFEDAPTYVVGAEIGKVVSKDSAARLSAIKALAIADNHVDMCKFPGDFAHGYVSVSSQLSAWIADLERRGKEDEDSGRRSEGGGVTLGNVTNNKGVVAGLIKAEPGGANKIIGSGQFIDIQTGQKSDISPELLKSLNALGKQ